MIVPRRHPDSKVTPNPEKRPRRCLWWWGRSPRQAELEQPQPRPGPAAPSLRVGAAERNWLVWRPQNRLWALKGLFPWALPGRPGHRSAALSVASGPPLCPQLTALGHRGLLSVHTTRDGVADPGSGREAPTGAWPPGTVYSLSRSPSPELSLAGFTAARSSEKRQEMLCELGSVT